MLSPLALKSTCSGLHRSGPLFVPPSPIPFLTPGARSGLHGAHHSPVCHSCCDKMAKVTSPPCRSSKVLAVPAGAVGVWDMACSPLRWRRRMEGGAGAGIQLSLSGDSLQRGAAGQGCWGQEQEPWEHGCCSRRAVQWS